MKMKLVIEPCSADSKVSFGYDDEIIYCSSQDEIKRYDSRDISSLVAFGLNRINKKSQDIQGIAVSVGPGRLTSVRSGVSFANSLAFSLKIPTYPFYSFELIGYEAWKKFSLPILCTIQSTDENAYICLYKNNSIKKMRYGKLNRLLKEEMSEEHELVVTGDHIESIKELLSNTIIHDSGIVYGKSSIYFETPHSFEKKTVSPERAIPVTEESKEFYEQT